MPYCQRCSSWYPGRVSACARCGDTLGHQAPPSVRRAAGPIPDEVFEAEIDGMASAILPDREAEPLDLATARAIAGAFDVVRVRFSGHRAAPLAALPASGPRVATALDLVAEAAEEGGDWPTTRRMREAFVDLQAFLPDADVAAAEAAAALRLNGSTHRGSGAAMLDRIAWAQATAISILRRDEQVIGAHLALRETDIVIGEPQRSLEAVDRYKSAQLSGIGGLVLWPLSVTVGFIAGAVLAGLSIAALAALVVLLVSGVFVGPWYGWQVGALSSRLDRLALRSDHAVVVAAGRCFATAAWLLLALGAPAAIGLAAATVWP